MIGIEQLDRLSSDDMVKIISGILRIKVRDPRKIQTIIDYSTEPRLLDIDENMLDDFTVKTLLRMELESRAGWSWLKQKIQEEENVRS